MMALINVVLNPSRGLELRTLEMPVDIAPPAAEGRNVVVALPNGGFNLCFDRFKNVKKIGRQVVVLPDSKDLMDALRAVVYTHRKTLVGRETGHRFLFVGPSGKAYTTSGAWSNALVNVFAAPLASVQPQSAASAGAAMQGSQLAPRVPVRVGTNVLRKSAVTHRLPECKTLADRVSFAASMRHGLAAQSEHYDAATSSERVAAAVNASAAAYDASAAAGKAGRAHRDQEDDMDVDSIASASDNDTPIVPRAAATTTVDEVHESDEEVFAVDRLMEYRVRGGESQYFVRWEAGPTHDSWEPEDEMPPALVRLFWRGPTARGGKGVAGPGAKRKTME
jgi:hypothetical protein